MYKSGFLSAGEIHNVFDAIRCDMKPKQIGQLVYPLHKDMQGRFSYTELIEFLFGVDTLLRSLRDNGLQHLYQPGAVKRQAEPKHLTQFSAELKIQCEFRYDDLEAAAVSLTDGFN